MDSADRLIEYYFQRKIAGMPSADIHQSLEQQMLEEEEREIIITQVEHKESLYLKAQSQRKMAKTVLLISLSLLLLSSSFLIYSLFSQNQLISPILLYTLMGFGAAGVLSSFFIFPKVVVPTFKQ